MWRCPQAGGHAQGACPSRRWRARECLAAAGVACAERHHWLGCVGQWAWLPQRPGCSRLWSATVLSPPQLTTRGLFPRPRTPTPCARWRALTWPGSLCAVAVLLSACGGSDSDSRSRSDGVVSPPVLPVQVAVSGVVADGPLKDPTVCHDLNDNNACATGAPRALTNDDGQYRFKSTRRWPAATACQPPRSTRTPACRWAWPSI